MRPLLIVLALLCSACSSTARKIDETLARMVPFGLSGSVLVADRGGVILSKGYGAGLRPDTIYDMGSITKSFTATAVLLLEEEGKLSIDDTLAKHFPGVPADKAEITLRQILGHSAGLADLIGNDYDPVPREKFLADFFATPLVSKPGAEYHYSNGGYSVLAAIVEDVSGKPYETFMRERLFAPAGMRDTTYRVPDRDLPRVAHTLTPPVDHGSPADRLARAGGVHWILLGNGGMLTTTEDLYRWEVALRRGTIVSPAVLAKLMTPIFKRTDTVSLAAAWTIETVDGERVMHHGSDAPELGVNGEYRRYPDDGFTVIFLGNTRVNGWSPRRIVGRDVRKLARGDAIDVPAVKPARDAARYAGTYALPDGSTIDIRAEGAYLVAGLTGQEAVDLFTVQRGAESLKSRRDRNARALALGYPIVLGTSRRDRGVFMTTVRDATGRTLRFSWAGSEPVPEGDDGALPHDGIATISPIAYALERPLWRENGDTFVFYDIYTSETIRVTFTGDTMKVGATVAERRRHAGWAGSGFALRSRENRAAKTPPAQGASSLPALGRTGLSADPGPVAKAGFRWVVVDVGAGVVEFLR
jgi:CubicO group peptidase (beta-lactamase class C family)